MVWYELRVVVGEWGVEEEVLGNSELVPGNGRSAEEMWERVSRPEELMMAAAHEEEESADELVAASADDLQGSTISSAVYAPSLSVRVRRDTCPLAACAACCALFSPTPVLVLSAFGPITPFAKSVEHSSSWVDK